MIRNSLLPTLVRSPFSTAGAGGTHAAPGGRAVRRNRPSWGSLGVMALWILCMLPLSALSQETPRPAASDGQNKPMLVQAITCEAVRDYAPWNPGVVFPTSIGKVLCFTSFDPVPRKTVIYHNWFHRDVISNKQMLTLQTPRWSSFSSIQLRESDKGPWRVEITDAEGRVLRVLRFSITD